MNLKAYDADAGNNSALWYNLTGGQDDKSFYIDPATGQLFSKTNIGQSQQKLYNIKVNVSDNWGRGLSAETQVKVCIVRVTVTLTK